MKAMLWSMRTFPYFEMPLSLMTSPLCHSRNVRRALLSEVSGCLHELLLRPNKFSVVHDPRDGANSAKRSGHNRGMERGTESFYETLNVQLSLDGIQKHFRWAFFGAQDKKSQSDVAIFSPGGLSSTRSLLDWGFDGRLGLARAVSIQSRLMKR
uniref:Uncharacterized protein n=1 Tax=Steinernema glaseri TaxID=37863 RepID=A0A1I7ZAQ6_9BILA